MRLTRAEAAHRHPLQGKTFSSLTTAWNAIAQAIDQHGGRLATLKVWLK
jgi:hypothetical protein